MPIQTRLMKSRKSRDKYRRWPPPAPPLSLSHGTCQEKKETVEALLIAGSFIAVHLSACGAFGVCTQAVLLSNTNIPLKRAAQTYCGAARSRARTGFVRRLGHTCACRKTRFAIDSACGRKPPLESPQPYTAMQPWATQKPLCTPVAVPIPRATPTAHSRYVFPEAAWHAAYAFMNPHALSICPSVRAWRVE